MENLQVKKRLVSGSVTKNGEATPLLNQLFAAFYLANPTFQRRKEEVTETQVAKNCEAVKKLSGVEVSHSAMKQYLTYGVGKWVSTSHGQLHSYESYGRFYLNAVTPLIQAEKLKTKLVKKQLV